MEREEEMKCPKCNAGLVPATRHKIAVNYCQSCKGMWLEYQELEQLEDEVFDFGDDEKGTLIFRSTATTDKCPECNANLRRFQYRLYDLELEFCENQHGYWLDEDEDTRVLGLMRKEEKDFQRKLLTEEKWATILHHMRSRSFLSKVRDLFR